MTVKFISVVLHGSKRQHLEVFAVPTCRTIIEQNDGEEEEEEETNIEK